MRERFKIRLRENWYRDVWLFAISAIVLYVVVAQQHNTSEATKLGKETASLAIANRELLKRFQSEGIKRRDESCRYFELQESVSTRRVLSTYDYLDHLPKSEWGSPLTQTIIQSLPDTYADAIANRAPDYCNDPGVGLKEPGSKLPKKRDFSFMLNK